MISVTTKREFIKLKFFQSDQKMLQNFSIADFSSALDPSAC